MIDPTDKQTIALPLDEQPAKKRRGRPATGQAMTPAEKQRAYRERLKAQQSSRPGAIYDQGDMDEAIRAYQREVVKLTDELNAALRRAEKAEKANKGNVAVNLLEDSGEWTIQFKFRRSGGWCSCDEPERDLSGKPRNFKAIVEHVRHMNNQEMSRTGGPRTTWRAIRDDGLIFEPKAPKSRGMRPAK